MTCAICDDTLPDKLASPYKEDEEKHCDRCIYIHFK